MALTQTQLVNTVADREGSSRRDARRALTAFDEVVLDELGNAQEVRIGGLVRLTVRAGSACNACRGRNLAAGEQITIAAERASVDVRSRSLARAKGALPGVQKGRRRLAA